MKYLLEILHLAPGNLKQIIHRSNICHFKNPEMAQFIFLKILLYSQNRATKLMNYTIQG